MSRREWVSYAEHISKPKLALACFACVLTATTGVYRYLDSRRRRPKRRFYQTQIIEQILETYERLVNSDQRTAAAPVTELKEEMEEDRLNVHQNQFSGESEFQYEHIALQLAAGVQVGCRKELISRLRLLLQKALVQQLRDIDGNSIKNRRFAPRSLVLQDVSKVEQYVPSILKPLSKEESKVLGGMTTYRHVRALKRSMFWETVRFLLRRAFCVPEIGDPIVNDTPSHSGGAPPEETLNDGTQGRAPTSLFAQRLSMMLLLTVRFGLAIAEAIVSAKLSVWGNHLSTTFLQKQRSFAELARLILSPATARVDSLLDTYFEADLSIPVYTRLAAADQWVIDVMGEKRFKRFADRAVSAIGSSNSDLTGYFRPLATALVLGIQTYRSVRNGTWPLVAISGLTFLVARIVSYHDEPYQIENHFYDVDASPVHVDSQGSPLVGLSVLIHAVQTDVNRRTKESGGSIPALSRLVAISSMESSHIHVVELLWAADCTQEALGCGDSLVKALQRTEGNCDADLRLDIQFQRLLLSERLERLRAERNLTGSEKGASAWGSSRAEKQLIQELDPEEELWLSKAGSRLMDFSEVDDLFYPSNFMPLRCLGLEVVHATRILTAKNASSQEVVRNTVLRENLGNRVNSLTGRLRQQIPSVVSIALLNTCLIAKPTFAAQVGAALLQSGEDPSAISLLEWAFNQAMSLHTALSDVVDSRPRGNSVGILIDALVGLPVTIDDSADTLLNNTRPRHHNLRADRRAATAPKFLTPPKLNSSIVFRNVRFSYPTTPSVPALNGLSCSFPLEGGGLIGIVGESGHGKSTLFKLLLRIYDPFVPVGGLPFQEGLEPSVNQSLDGKPGGALDPGEILIDGVPLTAYSVKALRRTMTLVPSKPFIIHGTVQENILLGSALSRAGSTAFAAPPEKVRAEVERAAKKARLHETILKFKEGYDTVIEPNTLSGGEEQRLAFARAFLRNPRVLLLDEATSHLDTETETQIQQVLDDFVSPPREDGTKGTDDEGVSKSHPGTIIAIAHRLSTLRNAKHIIVIHNGRCVQEGKPEDLLASSLDSSDSDKLGSKGDTNYYRRYVTKQQLVEGARAMSAVDEADEGCGDINEDEISGDRRLAEANAAGGVDSRTRELAAELLSSLTGLDGAEQDTEDLQNELLRLVE
jgi:ABC-type multidrug transport system fused ATPase/permease subunit